MYPSCFVFYHTDSTFANGEVELFIFIVSFCFHYKYYNFIPIDIIYYSIMSCYMTRIGNRISTDKWLRMPRTSFRMFLQLRKKIIQFLK